MIKWKKLSDKAIELFDKPDSKHRHFSFITYKNSILSIGWNSSTKTHPLTVKYGYLYPYVHSEIAAIVKFPEKTSFLKNCDIFNIRLGQKKQLRLARPCYNCQKLLLAFQFNQIFYSNELGLKEEFIHEIW